MAREIHAIHSKRECKNRSYYTFWIEFPGGCKFHFRGEEFAKDEACKHKLISLSNLEAAGLALTLARRENSKSIKVIDSTGAVIAFVSLSNYGVDTLDSCKVDIHPQCKCIKKYEEMPALEILEKRGENAATIKTLIRMLDGELPIRPLKMRT